MRLYRLWGQILNRLKAQYGFSFTPFFDFDEEDEKNNPQPVQIHRLGVCFLQVLQVLQQDAVEACWLFKIREVACFWNQFEL